VKAPRVQPEAFCSQVHWAVRTCAPKHNSMAQGCLKPNKLFARPSSRLQTRHHIRAPTRRAKRQESYPMTVDFRSVPVPGSRGARPAHQFLVLQPFFRHANRTIRAWPFSATRSRTKPVQTDSASCRLSSSEPPVPVHAPCYRPLPRHRRRPDSRSNEKSSACRPSGHQKPGAAG
jgi:hypothetical protein